MPTKRPEDMFVMLFRNGFGPSHSDLCRQIISKQFIPSIDEVFSCDFRYTSKRKTSLTTSVSFVSSAMVTHFPGFQCGQGCGMRGHSGGLSTSLSHGGRDIGEVPRGAYVLLGGRTQCFCTHYKKVRYIESYCYTLHLELRPT